MKPYVKIDFVTKLILRLNITKDVELAKKITLGIALVLVCFFVYQVINYSQTEEIDPKYYYDDWGKSAD